MRVYKTYRNNIGEVLKIIYDEDASNPLANAETLFHLYTWSRRFESIQLNPYRTMGGFIDTYLGEGSFDRYRTKCIESGLSSVEFANVLCEQLGKRKGILAFPILSYDHGDIQYYLGNNIDRWDGSVSGFAWVEKDKVYQEFGVSKISSKLVEHLKSHISSDLGLYNKYVRGDSYGFELYDSNGKFMDSLYGLYDRDDEPDYLFNTILSYLSAIDKSFVEVFV